MTAPRWMQLVLCDMSKSQNGASNVHSAGSVWWVSPYTSGWWFGTFVGFPYIENSHPNWIGSYWNHQSDFMLSSRQLCGCRACARIQKNAVEYQASCRCRPKKCWRPHQGVLNWPHILAQIHVKFGELPLAVRQACGSWLFDKCELILIVYSPASPAGSEPCVI